ncbi:MAG: hypothetical protein GY812_07485 [Actinomycetia bacterium]|nr:hypothetical protein [Actinomycetes bacterium]
MNVILDPTGELNPADRPLSDRLPSLSGRTVGLLDITKARGNVLLDRIEGHLVDRGAKVLRFSKPTFTKPAPDDLRRDIAQQCEAVIEALAD